jgi:hypothetical protein
VGANEERLRGGDPVAESLTTEAPCRIVGLLRAADRLLRPVEGYIAPAYGNQRVPNAAVLMVELEDSVSCDTRPVIETAFGWRHVVPGHSSPPEAEALKLN